MVISALTTMLQNAVCPSFWLSLVMLDVWEQTTSVGNLQPMGQIQPMEMKGFACTHAQTCTRTGQQGATPGPCSWELACAAAASPSPLFPAMAWAQLTAGGELCRGWTACSYIHTISHLLPTSQLQHCFPSDVGKVPSPLTRCQNHQDYI